MELAPMQYKTFIWPHNPRTYTIRYTRQVAVHKVPFGQYAMQDMGLTRRVMEGEGVFYGPNAYDTFKALASVFYKSGPGRLIHPVWQSANAYFTALSLAQEPKKDFVRYRFTFWETYDRYSPGLYPAENRPSGGRPALPAGSGCHTVKAGETMWGIAGRYGLTLEELVAKNPQVKNPNRIYPGDVLKVR